MQTHFDNVAIGAFPKIPLTPTRRFWVHDLDGVHHNYEGAGDIYPFYARIKYLALKDDFPLLTAEDIRRIGRESYDETGDGLLKFCDLMADDKRELFRERLLRLFHKIKFEEATNLDLGLLQPCNRTIELLQRISETTTHSILTQGCLRHWGRPVLESRGTWRFFDKHACLDFHDVGYKTKKLSTRPIEMALCALGCSPEQAVFLEDSPENLRTAKRYDPRILTVLIKPPDKDKDKALKAEFEPFIDIHVPNLVTFLEYAKTIFCAPTRTLNKDFT